jgi:hypothetical protein
MLVEELELYNELIDAGLIPDVPYNAATTQQLQVVRRIVEGLNRPLVTAAEQVYDKLERFSAEQKPELRKVGYASVYLVGTIYKGIPGRQYTIPHSRSWKDKQMPWSLQWTAVLGEEGSGEVVTGQAALLDLGNTFPTDWEHGSDTPTEALAELRRSVVHQIESDYGTSVQQTLADVAEKIGGSRRIRNICVIGEGTGGPMEWRVVAGDVVESERAAEQKGCWVTASAEDIQIGLMDPMESPAEAILAFGEHVDGLQSSTRAAVHSRKRKR